MADTGALRDPEVSFHERGVPYRIAGEFSLWPMASGGQSTLTLHAGVVLRFATSASATFSMNLGSVSTTSALPTRLIANGTPQAPIVLTSAADTPAAGDWGGVEWFVGTPTGNVMSNVHIEYAGADSGNGGFGCGPADNDAALFIGDWIPDGPFIEGCTFSDSAGAGIVCGWHSDGTDATIPPLFRVQNTFTNIGNGCNVSEPSPETGSCGSRICPM